LKAQPTLTNRILDFSSRTMLDTTFLGFHESFDSHGCGVKGEVSGTEAAGSLGIGLVDLARIRLLALRRRVFFKVLDRVERGLVYLTLKVLRGVHSKMLADALRSIVKKLLEAMETKVKRQIRQIGVPLAQKISRIAQKWGNTAAREWANDPGFVQYLTIGAGNWMIDRSAGGLLVGA
jgi:hypothetical protein